MSSSSSSSAARQKQRDQATALQSSLRPLLPLCAGIALRHRNQHRSSPWWSRFNIFRRGLAKACAPGARAADVLARAAWLHDRVVPSAYVAFSQLTADGRHAPVGLALMGALATVQAATAPIASSLAPKPVPVPAQPQPPALAGGSVEDFGLAVARSGPGTGPLAPATAESSTPSTPMPSATSASIPKESSLALKRKAETPAEKITKKKTKVKARPTARDDISKLFDSLL